MINHIKKWNVWRKCSLDGWFIKLSVLLKIISVPTFEHLWAVNSKYGMDKEMTNKCLKKKKEDID